MKRISLFAMALCAGIAVNAQDAPQLRTPMSVKPMFGIKAGLNAARLEVHDDASAGAESNSKSSLHAGIFYNIPIAGAFRIQPELIYNIQGTKTEAMASTDANLAGIQEIDLHYITLPVMFQMMTPTGFSVEVGPQVSFLSSANADRNNGSQVNLKEGNYVKKVDFALGGGVGYTTRVGLGLHAKYTYGFTNVWNNEESPVANSGMDASNRVFQVGLHYSFGASK